MINSVKKQQPYVFSVNISKGGIPKLPMDRAYIKESGLQGDGHNHDKHYRPIQAVSLQDIEKLLDLREEGYPLFSGTTGENITVCHLDINSLPLGAVLEFEGGVVLEISKIRTPCYVLDSIDPKLKEDIVDRCGMYAKVIEEGYVHVEEKICVKKYAGVINDSMGSKI